MGTADASKSILQITELFAVPFGFAKLVESEPLNRELKALLLERESQGKTYANPRPSGPRHPAVFESGADLFGWPEPCAQTLKDFCSTHVVNFVGELNGYDQPMRQSLLLQSNGWCHVIRRGGYCGLRNQPMATWSGVYCVDSGNSDPDKPESGLLSFVNPFLASAMYLDVSTAKLRQPYAYHIRQLRLEPGQLVLFPSWLLYEVKSYEGDGERVTVGFNCWFEGPSGTAPA